MPPKATSIQSIPLPPTSADSLIDLYEPLFQYLCRLNRIGRIASAGGTSPSGDTVFMTKGRAGASPVAGRSLAVSFQTVRDEIVSILQQIQRQSEQDYKTREQVQKLGLPIKFFIDSYIVESKLPFAREWNDNRLAYEENELAGDEKFFDIVEETLRDKSIEASERLAVYYVCFGLGFTGAFGSQVELLRKAMNDIAPRMQSFLESDRLGRFCEEAYAGVNTTNLIEPESSRLAILGIVFACFTLAAFCAFFFLYREASSALNTALDEVKQHDPQLVKTTK
jgi:type VI protein secretion system component VasF